jgi:WhiB family redox-sensing transcriptional regulator
MSEDWTHEPPESWMADGLCAEVDPGLFFVHKGGSTADAKWVCHHCPVIVDCAAYSLAHRELVGVWGATSERERRTTRAALKSAS